MLFTAISEIEPHSGFRARGPAAAFGKFKVPIEGTAFDLPYTRLVDDMSHETHYDIIYISRKNYEKVHSAWTLWKEKH
jgi:hypothetical protein